ncbi:MAG: hypothetical protein ABI772_11460 [Bacteroidota bacterium]
MMKKFLPFILLLAACSTTPKVETAQFCVNGYLDALRKDDFEAADKFYSDSYGLSDEKEGRVEKMKKLQGVLGSVLTYQLKDSLIQADPGEPGKVILTYEVKHRRVTTMEKYVVMNDEGNYRIVGQSVENK